MSDEPEYVTLKQLVEIACATISKLSPVEKARLRIQLRERFHAAPRYEPLIHGNNFENLEEFKPKPPSKNGNGHNGNGNGNGNSKH
jgi:hypothetical protein